jgi:hypothetical protein
MATNPPATGARVVSATTERLFETVEALFGRPLTEAERLSFTTRLAGINTTAVAPGDLITADLFNALRADINDLALRLASIEATATLGAPIITAITPADLTAGETITIEGRNLTPGLLTLLSVGFVDIEPRLLLSGSGPNRLILTTPGIIGLAAGGSAVLVRVGNAAGEAQRSIILRPGAALNLQAIAVFRLLGVSPTGALRGNTSYDYRFEVAITASQAETFNLTASITPRTGATGFTATIAGDGLIEIPQSPSTPVVRQFSVTVVTGATGAADLGLTLKGTSFSEFTQSSQLFPIVLAAAPISTSTQIEFGSAYVSGRRASVGGGAVTVTQLVNPLNPLYPPSPIILYVPITAIKQPGRYTFAVRSDPSTSDWNVQLNSDAEFLSSTASPTPAEIRIGITPKTTVPASAALELVVTGDGALPDASLRLNLLTAGP